MRNSREPGRGKPSRDTSFERRTQRAHIRKSDDAAYREAGGYENVVAGRNAVIEALKAGGRADTVYLQKGASGGSIGKIIALAKEGGYPVKGISNILSGRQCACPIECAPGVSQAGMCLTFRAG